MSVPKFQFLLNRTEYRKNDKKYFPLWVRRYADSVTVQEGRLPVTTESVIAFSRSLRDNRVPAWQRCQAVRAIEAYRDLVLRTAEPSFAEMRKTLQRLAEQERQDGTEEATGASRPGIRDEPHLVGVIDPNEPAVMQEMRRELRLRRKALDTERAYVGWVGRFIQHCGSEDLRQFGEREIKAFLTDMVVQGNVAPRTQNQAKSALLFLYQQLFQRELGFLDAVAANKPPQLPVVLSRREIALLLPEFSGLKRLMFLTLYGAGLRHRECRRLRVKDVCFDEGHMVVRTGKGEVDRITVLPDRCRQSLVEQIERVRRLHHDDLKAGFGAVYLPYTHVMNRPGIAVKSPADTIS